MNETLLQTFREPSLTPLHSG